MTTSAQDHFAGYSHSYRAQKMKFSSSTLVLAVLAAGGTCQSLPTVDLGYEVHQALSYNVSYDRLSLYLL